MGFMFNLSINANNSEFAAAPASCSGCTINVEGSMLKSALSLILAVSMLSFGGCYEVVSLSKDNYKNVNKYDEVNVLADTGGVVTKYRFSRGMCVVQNDTLIGTGTRMSQIGDEKGITVEIPESQINLIEVKQLNLAKSLTIAAVAIGATVGIMLLSGSPGSTGSPGSGGSPTPQ